MVKLEQWASNGGNGKGVVTGTVYVRPEDVISIQTSVYGDGTTVRTGISENAWVVVKGTPDEVHAKLFPEPVPAVMMDNVAAMEVLQWVASNPKTPPDDILSRLARKALGR